MKQKPYHHTEKEIEDMHLLNLLADVPLFTYIYEPGEFICQDGEEIPYLLFICKGQAKVFYDSDDGKRILYSFYDRGGILGDLEFFLSQSLPAKNTVQALSELTCIGFPMEQNKSVLMKCPEFIYHLGHSMARKMELGSRNGSNNLLYPLETRLCSYIDTTCQTPYFTEKLTDVADFLGTSYRHLLRALQSLVRENVLEKRDRHYYIANRTELQKRSKDFYQNTSVNSF